MVKKILLASEVCQSEIKLIDKACEIEGRKRANFIRNVILRKAKEVIEEDKKKWKKSIQRK